MTIDLAKLEALLEKVYERIDGEDYIGTCGCVCGSQPPENSLREDYCPCLREHNVVLAEIAAMKNALPELLQAARDEELLRWMLDDPVSARHLLLLLSEGKGNEESFRSMIRRIITSKGAAMKEASHG